MRKILVTFVLIVSVMSLLCVPALAADVPTDGGIYNVAIASAYAGKVTVEAQTADGTAVKAAEAEIEGKTVSDFYANAEKLKVTLTGAEDGDYYLILAQTDDEVPTDSNIVYIDQDTAASGSVSFTVYPSQLDADTTYYVYVASSSGDRAQLLTFRYYVAYTLGDVNEDGSIGTMDALWILQSYAGNRTLTSNQSLAADVNKDGSIGTMDALWVLQAYAGNRTL